MKKQVLIVIFLLSFQFSAGLATASTISVLPADSTWQSGEMFTLSIGGTNFNNTLGGGINVSWDPSVITLASLNDVTITLPNADPFFTSKGALSPGNLDNIYTGNFNGFSGDFDFAELTFTALAPGSTLITLNEVATNLWSDPFGDPISVTFNSASVTIVPEPASLFLLASGMMVLVALGRKKS